MGHIQNKLDFPRLGGHPRTSQKDDYAREFAAWQAAPNPHTRSVLLRKVDPVIGQAVKSYGGKGGPNIRSRARQLALKAFETYDPQKGQLKTHLLSQLQSLRRVAGRQQQIISRPEQVSLDWQALTNAERELRDQIGREPSDGQIADYTGLSFKRIEYIRRSKQSTAAGSLVDARGEAFSPASKIPGYDTTDHWINFIYADLSPIDQTILDYSFGLHGSPKIPMRQIAGKLGITVGAISQRAKKIQAMIDEQHETGLI